MSWVCLFFFFVFLFVLSFFCFLMIRRPPRSTLDRSSAASDVYKRQGWDDKLGVDRCTELFCQQRDVLDRGVLKIQDSVADANSGSG